MNFKNNMALAKRPSNREENIDPAMRIDENENGIKRKKRSIRQTINNTIIEDEQISLKDEKLSLPQKKRSFLPVTSSRNQNNINNNNNNNNINTKDDQDDETLIRETQAALKSLSGSWPDARNSLYKINDQDENPSFQNLFDAKQSVESKLSPAQSTTSNESNSKEVFRDYNGKIKADLKNYHKFRKERDSESPKYSSHYHQTPDFNELVDDSSNDLQIDMSDGERSSAKKCKKDDYPSGPKVPFSATSAFKPPSELRKNGIGTPIGPYPAAATFIGGYQPVEQQPQSTVMEQPTVAFVDNTEKSVKIKVEEIPKPIGSPDSKQYTILQPAGIGSRAASVMQDIAAREGVVSVSAVSSSSSPGIGVVSSSSGGPTGQPIIGSDKMIFDRSIPPLSPNSINRGEYIILINL